MTVATTLVPVSQIESLPAEYREHAVTAYLANARDRLADALEATGPASVSQIKAEVATVAEMTKQLGLSKECRDDATEMVRRAEYALGKAIRKGQEEGAIARHGEGGGPREDYMRGDTEVRIGDQLRDAKKVSVKQFFSHGEEMTSTYRMSDGVSADRFEDALAEARDEGNLSRANVARKIKQQDGPRTRDQRADDIGRLAREGHTSGQIAPKVGVTREHVRIIARDYGIDIPADRAVGKRKRIDADRVLSGVAESVAAAAYSLQQIDPLDLDQEAAQEWVDSLTESLSALRKALNPIKESLRD